MRCPYCLPRRGNPILSDCSHNSALGSDRSSDRKTCSMLPSLESYSPTQVRMPLLRVVRPKASFAYAQTIYAFLNEFDRYYVSGEMKLIKPDPQIYHMLETDCGVAPEALLFTDDRLENITAAKARGWQTHLFETPQGWADQLIHHNLITQEDLAL